LLLPCDAGIRNDAMGPKGNPEDHPDLTKEMNLQMYTGGLLNVTVDRLDEHKASIKFGEEKLLEIEINRDRKVAVHKRKKEKPIAVDAQELIKALKAILAS